MDDILVYHDNLGLNARILASVRVPFGFFARTVGMHFRRPPVLDAWSTEDE